MKIKLSPARSDDEPLIASVEGDTITVNGTTYDLSPLEAGEELPATEPFVGSIIRDADGVINLTLMLPHGANAPKEARFPTAFETAMDIESGDVPVPPYDEHPVEALPEVSENA